MKTHCLLTAWITTLALCASSHGATLTNNFEAGDADSDWGATWTSGIVTAGFLDPAFGGIQSGGSVDVNQGFSREFRNNTAGLDVTVGYTISMYVQIDTFDGLAGGTFEIADGSFGSNNAANLRIQATSATEYKWQARDNSTGWQDLGITMNLSQPTFIQLAIDPETNTYDATVSSVTGVGAIIDTGTLTGLAFDQNVINNNANGNLLFHVQASAGGTSVRVDNISIETTANIPEPAVIAFAGGLLPFWALRRRRSV